MSGEPRFGQGGSGARFLLVGVLAAALQLVLTYTFMRLGWAPALAVFVAFMAAFVSAYGAHRSWTFAGGGAGRVTHGRALPRYALTQLMSLALGAGVAELAASLLLPHALVAVAATVASGGLSYVLSSRWVFSVR